MDICASLQFVSFRFSRVFVYKLCLFAAAMAKNRSKKRNNGASMDIEENTAVSGPQAMDTSESGAKPKSSSSRALTMSVNVKGRPMKRTKNVRKAKKVAKAISQSEKIVEKVSKNEGKSIRTQSAKTLYE